MPDNKKPVNFESGRATAPPSVYYSSLLSSASEGYTHSTVTSPTDLSDQHSTTISQSPSYSTCNLNDFGHQRTQTASGYISDYSTSSSSHSYLSSPKADVNNHSFQSSHYAANYFTSSQICPSSFSCTNNSSPFSNLNNNNINNINASISNSNNNHSFEFTSTSKVSSEEQEDFNVEETLAFQSSEQLSSAAFNYSKILKPNLVSPPKLTNNSSNILLPPKCSQSKETVDLCAEKKLKRNLEGTQKFLKAFKNDGSEELNRSGLKAINAQDASQDLVTDSFLHLLQKKNSLDSLSYDLGDISPILVSIASKYKSEEVSGFKKKETNEDLKLMNDFLTKIILEKEEKRFKTLDEKKKNLSKETFDNLSNELNERKVKKDAMSHYQEDKTHKRASNYGDYNQWEYFGQDIQSSNSLNRRGHFSFGNTPQQHSVGWNQMGMGIPRQGNPYYTNPHGHMMPAHAHSDYRFNQWNNPNHKSIPSVYNAHSQNTMLPQTKMDIKHHAEISSSVQDFGLPIGSTSDFSKFRAASRDFMRRTPPSISEKSMRAGVRPDHLMSISSGLRNSTIRTPPMSNHPKTVINSPLSDLQMLVTNQENETPPQKTDNFQQESVDLSAHSEISKQKDNSQDATLNVNNKDKKDFRTSISVIQVQNLKSDINEGEKPVELTSKNSDKSSKPEIPPSLRVNNVDSAKVNSGYVVESAKESTPDEKVKIDEDLVKTSDTVEKNEELFCVTTKNEADTPKISQSSEDKVEEKEKMTVEEYSNKSETVLPSDGKQEDPGKPDGVNEKSTTETEEKCNDDVEGTKNCKRKAEDEESPSERKKVLVEQESQPEKILDSVEEENADLPTVTSTSTDAKPMVNEVPKKTPKKKPSQKSRIGRLSSGQSSGSERSLSCKKSKSTGSKEESRKKAKKSLCDMMDRRGPFLHVMGSRESPASVTVVNFPKGDDEDEKDKSSGKKQVLNASRTKHHNELDYRGRSRNGLYCSTLSARYDAHTTDYTWICVFCKKGPHYSTMGDLFGPYIISEDEHIPLDDFSGDEKDISDAQKRGGRNKKSLRSNNMVEHFQKMSKKLRRTHSTESCLTGMTVISDDQVDQLRYEVWVHEQCAVWSPNVFLIGSRIIGMQEAIWCSVKTMCSKCGIAGANIGCVYRNCPNRSHYHCAKECGWSLQQKTFISTCHIHKPRS